jgi:hypothetical protein
VYGGIGLCAVAGGVTVGGFAVVTTGSAGAGPVALIVVLAAILLSYRALRVRRAHRLGG